MAITSANRTLAGARDTESQIQRDVSKHLHHIGEPTAFSLITLLGGYSYADGSSKPKEIASRIKQERAKQPKHEIIEKDPLARTVVTAAAVTDTTTTTVVLAANANCRVGDLLINKVTGECVFVYAVDAGGANLSVRRNLGSTTYQIGSGDTFYIASCAWREGTAKADQKSQIATPRTRYLQIFKRSFGITGTLEESEQEVDIKAWDEERMQAAYNHKLDIENACWLNPAADSTTDASSGAVYLSRGLIAEIGDSNTSFYDGSFEENWFFGEFAQRSFRYGSRRKQMFVNADAMTSITGFGRVKQQLKPMDTKYGLKITEIETGHGIFEIVMGGNFDNAMPSDIGPFGAVLDLDYLRFRSMSNRNFRMDDDIETPGTDAREGQFITEAGFVLYSLPNHQIMRKKAA